MIKINPVASYVCSPPTANWYFIPFLIAGHIIYHYNYDIVTKIKLAVYFLQMDLADGIVIPQPQTCLMLQLVTF